jgi:hypothetical protein
MSDEREELLKPAAVLGACLLLGLVAGGWLLGAKIADIKLADRTVTVKGLVERTVKSDRAIWAITFKTAGDDLPTVFAHSEANKSEVLKFLSDQGVKPGEVTTGQISVTDKQTDQFAQNGGSRYILQQTVTVSTADVDKLAAAGEKTSLLVQAGVVLADNSTIVYQFTGLNALKPDMITEATRNARASADRFAADSGSQVGVIRSANQGVFSISAEGAAAASATDDNGDAGGGNGDSQADGSIMKKVRVVATIEYYLK